MIIMKFNVILIKYPILQVIIHLLIIIAFQLIFASSIYAGGNKPSTVEEFNSMLDRIPNNPHVLEGLARLIHEAQERDNILLNTASKNYNFGWEALGLFVTCTVVGYIIINHGTSIWNFFKDNIIKFNEFLSQMAYQSATQSLRISFSRLTEESQRHIIQQLANMLTQNGQNSA